MEFIKVSTLHYNEIQSLKELWNAEYPECIRYNTTNEFNNYLDSLIKVNHVLVKENNTIVGWYADFEREEERWFLMILNQKTQGKGIGKHLISNAKQNHSILNGWVVTNNDYKKSDGTLYKSPIGFYKKLGFTFFEDITLNSSGLKAIKIQLKS
ncbi:GNAT family N-acetyltransferase [Tenacibaculum jejuense]|uniref:N-acetyltransferase domain-containing protein n=1 Tax=Tenacibaculum jejuense TaxID=584609 RepID=A0A238U871_9FLAO|nr:GNAT family N-acetyltransferase [Tenacibaculum jejuense]SNR14600.1 conserved protein of unknown function [Tenacibaculum jejuense]